VDLINGRGGNDLICGGPTPVRTGPDGGDLYELLLGGAGSDRIKGGGGPDDVRGGGGADVLSGGRFADSVRGGPGADRVSGDSGGDELTGSDGADLMIGGNGRDRLFGNAGDDVEFGDAGPDILIGDKGDDTLRGGSDHDVADFAAVFTAHGSGENDTATNVDLPEGLVASPLLGHDKVAGVEEVWTGSGDDQVVGTAKDETFYTSIGDDTVDGQGGTDTITFDGRFTGSWFDVTVDVDLSQGTAVLSDNFSDRGHTQLANIENVIGTIGADTIVGDDLANVLVGGPGFPDQADVISGLGGDDRLVGGHGDDDLDGGTGTNTTDGGPGTDTCANPGPGQPGSSHCELAG
jgi:Ca2+-binding RTX toxin-like protein